MSYFWFSRNSIDSFAFAELISDLLENKLSNNDRLSSKKLNPELNACKILQAVVDKNKLWVFGPLKQAAP